MRYKLVLLLMILASILTACGGGGDADPTETTTDSEATEAAPETDSGDADSGSVELSETFSGATAASGTLTVNYPSGWTQAGTADALSLSNTDAGTVLSVSVMPAATASTMGSSPSEILASYASTASAAGLTYSEPEEATFGSNSGAVVSATGNGTDSIIAIVDVNGSYVLLTLAAPEGEMDANRALLEAIAASVALES